MYKFIYVAHFIKVFFVIALVKTWEKQLGNYTIDYDTLTIVKMIAQGVIIQIALSV